jgi:hypothetical protein
VNVAYADPPYPGMAHYYRGHADYAGELDHADLIARLDGEYDAWALHTASSTLRDVLALCPADTRVLSWVKTWASLKPGVWPFYAWEPVLIRGARRLSLHPTTRAVDWFAWPMATGRGLKGAKPEPVIRWVFTCLGLQPGDVLVDLFPGTGAVARAWEAYERQPEIPAAVVERGEPLPLPFEPSEPESEHDAERVP